MLGRMWRKRALLHCWWDCKLLKSLWKAVWWYIRKLDIVVEDLALPLLGIYQEDASTCNKDTYPTIFIAALFIIARNWKEPSSFNRGMETENYSAIKNNEFVIGSTHLGLYFPVASICLRIS